MRKNIFKTYDWALLAIFLADEKGLSPVRLQKSLFLLGKEFPRIVGKNYYEFIPYNYGPFCAKIYDDVGALISKGFVEEKGIAKQTWSEYFITPAGRKYVGQLPLDRIEDARGYLFQVIEWAQGLMFQELISAIYKAYPEYKKHSVF